VERVYVYNLNEEVRFSGVAVHRLDALHKSRISVWINLKGSILTLRRFDARVLPVLFCLLLFPLTAAAQNAQTPAQAPPPPPTLPPPPPLPPAPNTKSSLPDYPDPRTFTIGAFYWMTLPVVSPDLRGGSQALYYYQTIYNLGDVRPSTPGIEISFPITRTGELHFEYFRAKGDGNQTAPSDLYLFGTGFNQGDSLATNYKIQVSKLYLDDLLFPHKFPVAKFRLKSLWEVQYVHTNTTIDDLTYAAANAGAPNTAIGTKQIFLPTFGIAAEYAPAPHLLLRVDSSGFGIPHKSAIWDAEATISYRIGSWEIRGGGKTFHFKTTPNSDQYLSDTLVGAFVGLRWHWSL
jgi:hypothetical protein